MKRTKLNNKKISEEYLRMQRELHENPGYGVASLVFSPIVADLIKQAKIKTVTDYGAGKKRLLEGLTKAGTIPEVYKPYDPVFPEYGNPEKADLVCCIDVLEHIEPDKLDSVLEELDRITVGLGFFSIHLGPAAKILSDGRNAHLIQEQTSWWLRKISKFFNVLQLVTHDVYGKGIWIIVEKIKIKDQI